MKFKIAINQTTEDKATDNNRHRLNTIFVSETLNPIKIQLPVGYEGPKNENGKELYHTPEDLYLGAVSGCFFTTFSVVSSNSNLKYISMQISSEGEIDIIDGVKWMHTINQTVKLIIPESVSEKKALKILEKAEENCPLGNSVKTKIINTFLVEKQSQSI
jgi:organic hydroperoxide reductase OsmC/OhrA